MFVVVVVVVISLNVTITLLSSGLILKDPFSFPIGRPVSLICDKKEQSFLLQFLYQIRTSIYREQGDVLLVPFF